MDSQALGQLELVALKELTRRASMLRYHGHQTPPGRETGWVNLSGKAPRCQAGGIPPT